MNIVKSQFDRLEAKYRGVLKRVLSLPEQCSSSAVYLMIGILPAEAQRDLTPEDAAERIRKQPILHYSKSL